jgi:curved DNA-binding protein CbpA
MATLYDILGLAPDATTEDVNRAYASRREADAGGSAGSDRGTLDAMAWREAHAILSNPARRQAYDRKLALAAAPAPVRAEPHPVPWGAIALCIGVLLAALALYLQFARDRAQADLAARENSRLAAEVEKARARADSARAEADLARREVQANAQRLEREKDLPAPAPVPAAPVETPEQKNERYQRMLAGPQVSQSEFESKVSLTSFKVVSIDPDKFDIEVSYNYDPSVGDGQIYAWAGTERALHGPFSAVPIVPGQNAHMRISVLRSGNYNKTSTTRLTIVISRSWKTTLTVKKVYPWTHTWPEVKAS